MEPAITATSTRSSKSSVQLREEVKRLQSELARLKKPSEAFGSVIAVNVESRREAINTMVAKVQALDLCFLLDATGSMQSCMDMVKQKMPEIAAGIKAKFSLCNLRVAMVPYRDYDDHDLDEDGGCDFTTDFNGSQSTFAKFLSSVCAEGGDDVAEDVFTGLQRVANLDWQARSRLLVHIGDAPCHGTRFHDLPKIDSDGALSDNYPDGDKYGRDIADLLKQLRVQRRISQYFFCHVGSITMKMIREFKKVAGVKDWIKDNLFKDIDKIPQEVVTISRSTISRSISTTPAGLNIQAPGFDGLKFIPEAVVTSTPDWEKALELKGHMLIHKWYSSLDKLFQRIRDGKEIELERMESLVVKVAPHPFSDEGAIRRPYYALVLQPYSRSMVVKRFKMAFGENVKLAHSKERYLSQMEVQTVAARMAHEFNDRIQAFNHQKLKRVEFTRVSTVDLGGRVFNMEEYLEGKWVRYSNNAGYVNTIDYAPTLQAFTHWTYERSGGQLMVTDLQGVVQPLADKGSKSYMFWLCDPAIHCTDLRRFTGTNLGKQGFKLFFDSHTCDEFCRYLSLKPRSDSSTKGTTMFLHSSRTPLSITRIVL